jgi:hypothetical protein
MNAIRITACAFKDKSKIYPKLVGAIITLSITRNFARGSKSR